MTYTIEQYRAALAVFDWQCAFIDDFSKWQAAQRKLKELNAMQAALDPTGEIWLSQPGASKHGAPQPTVRKQ